MTFPYLLTTIAMDNKMPPKQTARKRQLMEDARKGREARKKLRMSIMGGSQEKLPLGSNCEDVQPSGRSSLCLDADVCRPGTSTAAAVTPSGNARPEDILRNFSEQWKLTLDQEDTKALALFLCHIFTSELKMSHSKAAEHTAKIIGRTDRTIRQWRSDLVTYGEIRESRKGKYERPQVLWANKDLNDKARAFVQANTAFMVHGKQSTMKVKDFCQWVNESLLPSHTMSNHQMYSHSVIPGHGYAPIPPLPPPPAHMPPLPPPPAHMPPPPPLHTSATTETSLPTKISKETARKWLRELGL